MTVKGVLVPFGGSLEERVTRIEIMVYVLWAVCGISSLGAI